MPTTALWPPPYCPGRMAGKVGAVVSCSDLDLEVCTKYIVVVRVVLGIALR